MALELVASGLERGDAGDADAVAGCGRLRMATDRVRVKISFYNNHYK